MKSLNLVLGIAFLSTMTAFAQGSNDPGKWGKVVCEAVTQAEAMQFATTDEYGLNKKVPVGTISCALPLQFTVIDGEGLNDPSYPAYYAQVNLADAPVSMPNCQVTYFDSSIPSVIFFATGSGDGYVNLVRGSTSVDVAFTNTGENAHAIADDYVAIEIGTEPTITWADEITGIGKPTPIVSKCHIELPQ